MCLNSAFTSNSVPYVRARVCVRERGIQRERGGYKERGDTEREGERGGGRERETEGNRERWLFACVYTYRTWFTDGVFQLSIKSSVIDGQRIVAVMFNEFDD